MLSVCIVVRGHPLRSRLCTFLVLLVLTHAFTESYFFSYEIFFLHRGKECRDRFGPFNQEKGCVLKV